MTEIRCRPGTRSDLPAIVAIYNHYVTETAVTFEVEPVRVEDRSKWFDEHAGPGPHRLVVAAEPDGDVVGWATTSPFHPRAGYATTVESSVYCRADRLGRGIGARLYASLFAAIEAEDVERIVAGIALPNPASVALHQRFGFRPVGTFTRVGRKHGRFWDVAWFERPGPRAGSLHRDAGAHVSTGREDEDDRGLDREDEHLEPVVGREGSAVAVPRRVGDVGQRVDREEDPDRVG